MTFTYEYYNQAQQQGFVNFRENIPDYITSNLRHPLRPYQEEAIGRYLYYKTDAKHRAVPEQVLYNMATGSGKTILMAAMVLEKYHQGERNFIFFVNNDNILTKTRSNFLPGNPSKYLFADKIVMDHQVVPVREVTDFSDADDASINIVFTTIQKLHLDLNTPKENRLTYEAFEDLSVVLLADEAHHLNAGLTSAAKKDNASWTDTVEMIQRVARKSSLFEFTATIDLTNKALAKKYEKSLIYMYDLKEFRLDRFSKDVLFHLVDSDLSTRMLHAVLMSQYRKKVALKHGLNIKPLILFKSLVTKDSQANMDLFQAMLEGLTVERLQQEKESLADPNNLLTKAFQFFEREHITFSDLIEELQEDFRSERLMIIDGKNKTSEKLIELNTLELPSNEIRAIFAVELLNEGWDVLNLFDIVRLYDKRDGTHTKNGYKPGSTTNAEKQLIGRGARYFPFTVKGQTEDKYKRKFDENEQNELRVLEQLHYHAANNPKYISEMKQVLRESGIYDDEGVIERELRLKDSFKKTRTYTHGRVWMNKRLSYEEMLEKRQESFDTIAIPELITITLPTSGSADIDIFGDDTGFSEIQSNDAIRVRLDKIVDNHILRHALNRNKKYSFKNLREVIFGIRSMSDFMNEVGRIELELISGRKKLNQLTQEDKLYIADKVLASMEDTLLLSQERYYGSETFESFAISDVFEDYIVRRYTISGEGQAEFGLSQKERSNPYFEDIDALQWFAYDDNFGTSEEKLLVRTLNSLMEELEEKWSDIYLLRNEKAVRIYNFEDGRAFEPDFLLFANDKKSGNVSWQIFIEPKGSQFSDENGGFDGSKEGWKQRFLAAITARDNARTLVENDQYRIVGLPFYNDRLTGTLVKEKLLELE